MNNIVNALKFLTKTIYWDEIEIEIEIDEERRGEDRRGEERRVDSCYLGTFKNIRKLYPKANCNLEKYSPLKIREAGGDSWGP